MQELLPRCCNSLLVQKNLDFLEVLIINDGSKDNSLQIALEYCNKYPGIFKAIDKANGNYGSCINRGLKESTGKYIKILDADDYYDTHELDNLLDKLKTCNSDIIFTPYTIREFNLDIKYRFSIAKKYINKESEQDVFNFEKDNLHELRRMHCMCTKSSILKDNKYFQTEGISYTDTQFVFYSFLYGKSIILLNYNIYQYCIGRNEQTTSQASIIRCNMHFYENAYRLLSDYKDIDINTSPNKNNNLKSCINSELSSFVYVIFYLLNNNKKQINSLKELIQLGKTSNLPYNIEKELENDRRLILWYKYKIPTYIFYLKDNIAAIKKKITAYFNK